MLQRRRVAQNVPVAMSAANSPKILIEGCHQSSEDPATLCYVG
jgi:hypothetical protein